MIVIMFIVHASDHSFTFINYAARGVIYDCNTFIIQVMGVCFSHDQKYLQDGYVLITPIP